MLASTATPYFDHISDRKNRRIGLLIAHSQCCKINAMNVYVLKMLNRQKCFGACMIGACLINIFVFFCNLQMLNSRFFGLNRPDEDVSSSEWQHPVCNCTRDSPLAMLPINVTLNSRSTCGLIADMRGPHQRVISYSFYGPLSNRYFIGVARNAEAITKLYPGWVMRVYHNISTSNQKDTKQLCDVVCKYPHLDDCYVGDLDGRLGVDLNSKFGMLWRFMVLGDPLVDIFSCRDLDSTVQQREVDAVNQWMESNLTWHTCRDHPAHRKPMMGCCWGVKNSDDFPKITAIRDEILEEAKEIRYGYDELLLKIIVYPKASASLMTHDSYKCGMYPGSIPFPTRRTESTHVGSKIKNPKNLTALSTFNICPEECRPVDHQDWQFC